MEKSKRDLILALVLVAVCLSLLGKNFIFKKKPAVGVSSLESAQAKSVESVAMLNLIRQNQSLWQEQESEAGQAWGRDPFMPEGSGGAGGSAPFDLSGIVWDEKMPIAMVNGRVLKKGDSIENYKVVEIKPSSIVLEAGEEKIELKLFQTNN